MTPPDRALRGTEPCPQARSLGLCYRLEPAEACLGLDPATLGRLAIESWFYLWFNVGKHWAKVTGNRRMLERVT